MENLILNNEITGVKSVVPFFVEKEEKGTAIIFISHYPVKKRPFYTYPDPDDPEYTMSFDMLGRGTEWMTGGRRINDYSFLLKMAKDRNVDPEKL